MSDICLRKVLEGNRYFPNDQFKTRLVLLCCNVCKKIELKENLNNYEKLLVFPLLVSQKRDDNFLMNMLGVGLLENLAEEFGNAEDEKVEKFLTDLQEVAQSGLKYSHEWLNNISESTYCKIAARLYSMQCYDLLFMIAIQYIVNMTIVKGSNVRTNWYYKKNKEEPFFQIGIALDEGIVQTLTEEICNHGEFKGLAEKGEETESLSFLSEAYFFEMKFFDKLIDTFKLDRLKFLGSSFSNNCLDFLVKETRKIDYCDLYNLLSLSDQQKWKEVNNILKKYRR